MELGRELANCLRTFANLARKLAALRLLRLAIGYQWQAVDVERRQPY
jgi:hypothetical protein